MAIFFLVLGINFAAYGGRDEGGKESALRIFLSEVQPGAMATEQHCMLVFTDRRFHEETANRKMGSDRLRKIYEGKLSETDWNTLGEIIDAKGFRELKVPQNMGALVIENSHPYTISVAREKGFQNMEFLDKKSLKPYEQQVRPLLQWWKTVRSIHMAESEAPADSRCMLDSSQAILSH